MTIPVMLRRVLVELAVVLVPAAAVLLGVAPFGWSTPAALLACAVLPLRHVWPPLALLGCVWGLVGGLGWPPALVALYALGRRSTGMRAALPWLVLPVVAAVAPLLVTQQMTWQQLVLTVAFVALYAGAPAVMGLLVSTRARLTESLRQLERAREDAVTATRNAAQAQERARIGREIHDAVGHHATLIAVGAAAIAASTGEDETRRGAEQLRVLAKSALAEMRAALGLVDDGEHAAGLTEIAALVAGARSAGVTVELAHDGEPEEVAPGTGRAVYRVVQESLTNAARHAPGAPVRVELCWRPGQLQVVVRNAPAAAVVRPRRETIGGSGAGLLGLAERVASAGGQFAAGPTADGGFMADATFPLTPAAACAQAPHLDRPSHGGRPAVGRPR